MCSVMCTVSMATSRGRYGMLGKDCRVLQSSGIAPKNHNTWQLLGTSLQTGVQQRDSLGPLFFDLVHVVHKIQHLIDVINIPLPISICAFLRSNINL